MKYYSIFLFILSFSFKAYSNSFPCEDLSSSLIESQKHIVQKQCETLQSLYAYEKAVCALDVKTKTSPSQNGILSLAYHLSYQCPGDLLKTEKSFIYNWLKDGRSIPVKAVWFSLTDDDRAGILNDVRNDQDPDGRCLSPLLPTKINISEDVIIFSGFYPNLDNPIQNKACDVSVLRPPSFLDAYLETDTLSVCKLPNDLAIRASQLLTLAPEFLKDTQDKQLATQIWEVFPKNYRELVFMAGSWWYPGWEALFENQDFLWSQLKISETKSLEACQGPLFTLGANDLLEIWHKLYFHMDPELWITTNLRMQTGLWQADAINAFADLYPSALQDDWNEYAEAKAWMNLDVKEISGLIAWVNSSPEAQCDKEIIEECDYSLIMPFIPVDTLPISQEQKDKLNQKINEARAEFLK